MDGIMKTSIQDTETEWLEKARRGEEEAFTYLVEAYQRPVYNLCYRMLGNARDAEDAAQESFLRAFKAIRRYDPTRKFSTWLLTIASNYCIDQHRRRKLPTFSYDSLPVPDIPAKTIGMEKRAIHIEDQETVTSLLDVLKSKDRSVVIMRYWYDYSYEEIAQSLSLSISAVKSRLHRARRELASEWLMLQKETLPSERTRHESPAF
jgi:RNA polymerase sigma-70 factor (ECF subfamily)